MNTKYTKCVKNMKFRPCIDLHQGKVKQIIGSTLNVADQSKTVTNYQSDNPASWFAELYKADDLRGGHVIRLGEGNDLAAMSALNAWREGLQIGGGINSENAKKWLDAGASQLIFTSYIFKGGKVYYDRLRELNQRFGKERIVLDLSCKKKQGKYFIMTDYWKTFSEIEINHKNMDRLSQYCSEFLIHGVDVEGKQEGVEEDLITILGQWDKHPITYAGGVNSLKDIKFIKESGRDHVDFTVGSALDIFGGKGLRYKDLIDNQKTNFVNLSIEVPP